MHRTSLIIGLIFLLSPTYVEVAGCFGVGLRNTDPLSFSTVLGLIGVVLVAIGYRRVGSVIIAGITGLGMLLAQLLVVAFLTLH